jgi:4-hydroxybenzoate polyprenyltransferase
VIDKLSENLRSKNWRLSLLPFIMGCVYLWIWHFGLPWEGRTLLLVLLSLVTAAGFAALGYFINEFFDQRHDALAGKPNRITPLSTGQRLMVLSATVTAAFAPWLWLPADGVSWVLIASQVGLFLVYSLPFPRLKAVPIASNLVDTGYAYLVPLLLSFRTYMLFAEGEIPRWLWPLMVVVALIGLRNILIHQVNDLFNDRRAGMRTLPQVIGPKGTTIALIALIGAEVVAFLLFGKLLAAEEVWMSALPVLVTVFYVVRVVKLRDRVALRFIPLEEVRHLTDPFYQLIFPVILLVALTMADVRWLMLLPFHAALLTPAHVFTRVFAGSREAWWWADRQRPVVRAAVSASVNYPIYWFFRLFGVDLVREGKSATGFIRSKFS